MFGELGQKLNPIGIGLAAVSIILGCVLPIIYGISVLVLSLAVNQDTPVDKFWSLHKFISISFVTNLILFANTFLLFIKFRIRDLKWTPKSDLAFTYLLTSNLAAILIAIVLIMIDYSNDIAVFIGFIISIQGHAYFSAMVSSDNSCECVCESRKISITEKLSEGCFSLCVGIQFIVLVTVSENSKELKPSKLIGYRNLIVGMVVLMVLNFLNNRLSKMSRQKYERITSIPVTKYKVLDFINGILILPELVTIFFFLEHSNRIVIGLLIVFVIHGMIYFTQMHLYISYEEQNTLYEKESQIKAKLKRKKDLVDDLSKHLTKLGSNILSMKGSIHGPSFEIVRRTFIRYQELNQIFEEKICNQIMLNDGDLSVEDFKKRLDILEKYIISPTPTTTFC